MDWLLDTNVLWELYRPRPELKVVRFVESQPLERMFVSTVTLAEIRYGIERLTDVGRRASLDDWLTHTVRPMFGTRALPVDEDVMLRWRLLMEEGRRVRFTFGQPDLIIAATASLHSMTVVTRNIRDFAQAGVALFNPWTDEAPQ